MPDALVPVQSAPLASLAAVDEQARTFVQQSKAPATWRAYRSDWLHFERWCAAHGQLPLPAAPETVARYLTDQAERCKVSTLHPVC